MYLDGGSVRVAKTEDDHHHHHIVLQGPILDQCLGIDYKIYNLFKEEE